MQVVVLLFGIGKTTMLYHKIKAHKMVCSCIAWLPHETSGVVTAGWDGSRIGIRR